MEVEKSKSGLSEFPREKPISQFLCRILMMIKNKVERILDTVQAQEGITKKPLLERRPRLEDWNLEEIDLYIDQFKALNKIERRGVLLYVVDKEKLTSENESIHEMAEIFKYLIDTFLDAQVLAQSEWEKIKTETTPAELMGWFFHSLEVSAVDVNRKHSSIKIANLLYFLNKIKKEALNLENIYTEFYNEKLKQSNSVMFEDNGDGCEGKIIKLGKQGSFKTFFKDQYKRFGNIADLGINLKNENFLEAKNLAFENYMRETNVDGYLFRFEYGSRAYCFAMKLTYLGNNPYNKKPLFSLKFQDITDAQNKAELFEKSDTPQAILNLDGTINNLLNDLNAEFRRIFAEKLNQDVKKNNVYTILGLNESEIDLIKKNKQFNKIIPVGDRFYEFILKQEHSMVYISSHDVTELNKQATIDPLTKTLNRRTIFQELQKAIERSNRDKSSLSAIMLDFDHFKEINDKYGHHTGDIVLEQVAKVLTENLRQTDQIGRYGGEEFLIVLPRANLENASKKGEELRAEIEKMEIPFGDEGKTIKITISLGVAEKEEIEDCSEKREVSKQKIVQKRADCSQQLVNDADKALLSAKTTGRNQCCYYDSKTKGLFTVEKED